MNQSRAEELFLNIGTGRENAVKRPNDPGVDRHFRNLIETANKNNDCIISGVSGYYRPRNDDPAECLEFNAYMKAGNHQAMSILYKLKRMKKAFKKGVKGWQTAGGKVPMESVSFPQNSGSMVLIVDEDNSIPGQMAMRM